MAKFMFFDFRCLRCDHKFEAFVKPDVTPSCPMCFSNTKRLMSAPRVDLGITSDKWARTNAKKVAEDKKFYKEHGTDKKHHSYGS